MIVHIMALFGVRKGKEESNPTCIRMKSSLWAMSTLSTGRQERLRAAQGTPMLEGSEEGGSCLCFLTK